MANCESLSFKHLSLFRRLGWVGETLSQESRPSPGENWLREALRLRDHHGNLFFVPFHTIRDEACTCSHDDCTRPSKHPRTGQGYRNLTRTHGTLQAYHERWPDANLALVTGTKKPATTWKREQGVLVVDVDTDDNGNPVGFQSLARLTGEHGALPPTLAWETGSGGVQLAFHYPPHVGLKSRSDVLPGIDVRAESGCAILPPSVNESGPYRWLTEPGSIPIADAPDWLLNVLLADQELRKDSPTSRPALGGEALNGYLDELRGSGQRYVTDRVLDAGTIPVGARTVTVFRCACSGRGRGAPWTREEAREFCHHLNEALCEAPLADEEIERVVHWVYDTYPPGPSTAPRSGSREPVDHDPVIHGIPCMALSQRLIRFQHDHGGVDEVRCGKCVACNLIRCLCCLPKGFQAAADERGWGTVVWYESLPRDRYKSRIYMPQYRQAKKEDLELRKATANTPLGRLNFTTIRDTDTLREKLADKGGVLGVFRIESPAQAGALTKAAYRSDYDAFLTESKVSKKENGPGGRRLSHTGYIPESFGLEEFLMGLDGEKLYDPGKGEELPGSRLPAHPPGPGHVETRLNEHGTSSLEGEWTTLEASKAIALVRAATDQDEMASDKDAQNEDPSVSILQQPKTAEQPGTVIPLDGDGSPTAPRA